MTEICMVQTSSLLTFSELEQINQYKLFLSEAMTTRQPPRSDYRSLFSRSLGVSRHLSRGSVLQESDIVLKKLCQVFLLRTPSVVGKVLSQDVYPENLLSPQDFI